MAQYFFSVSKAERENILDQHKTLYDGYVTRYNQESNQYPLYVQDLANDKGGITVSNTGNVTKYKNVGINENMLDRIGDGPTDLKNGTVDLSSSPTKMKNNTELYHDVYPSPNEDEEEYISLGRIFDEEDSDKTPIFAFEIEDEMDEEPMKYEYDIEELDDFMSGPINDIYEEVDSEVVDEFKEKLYESLDMFKRFEKYN
jgi:hypothetical protein